MPEVLKSIKPWQIGALIVILLGAFGGTAGVYLLVSGDDSVDLSANQQLIPVQRGDLVNDISIDGSLIFPVRETFTFGTDGTVTDVLVEEGDSVQEGQVLARLDAETIVNLEQALAKIRVDLEDAESDLEGLLNPTVLYEVEAEANITSARTALKSAEDALEDLLELETIEVVRGEVAIAEARLAVLDIKEALETLLAGPTEDQISDAESDVELAESSLENARRGFDLARREWDTNIALARETFDETLEAYTEVYEKWLGIELSESEIGLSPKTLQNSWGLDVEELFSSRKNGSLRENPDTKWSELILFAWLSLFPGAIDPVEDIDTAWDTYIDQKDSLDTIITQAASVIAERSDTRKIAEKRVAAAKDDLEDLAGEPEPLEIERMENDSALAQANQDQATLELAALKEGADELEIEAQQMEISLAQARLDSAIEELGTLRSGVSDLQIALKESEIASGLALLESTLAQIQGAVVKAPWNGIITQVNIESGQRASLTAAAFEITDPTVVELDGIIDEIDVLSVRLDAIASVTMDALPGRVLQGTVSSIAAAPNIQQGVVSFPVRIQIEIPQGLQLPEGLSAVARVVSSEELDVILIPTAAIGGSFLQPTVQVMTNGIIEVRPVVLGNSDDFWVVVQDGLTEADQVVMDAPEGNAGGFNFGTFRTFGGGFPGGGGGNFRRFGDGSGPGGGGGGGR